MIKEVKRLGVVIQARLGSVRFPGKVLMPFCLGDTVLEYLIKRIRKAGEKIPIIVATSNEHADDKILDVLGGFDDVFAFRGDENNVLNRFIECAKKYDLKKIIRVCADNPLLDVDGLKRLIDYMKDNDVDYVGYYIEDIPAIKTHFGLWAEGVSAEALEKVSKRTKDQVYLEHVTNYIYEHDSDFDIARLEPLNKLLSNGSVRFTMDTKNDYLNLRQIIEMLGGKDDSVDNILRIVLKNERLLERMKKEILLNKK